MLLYRAFGLGRSAKTQFALVTLSLVHFQRGQIAFDFRLEF